MNALVRKELRLILPFFGVALFLAVAPALLVPREPWLAGLNGFIFCALGFGGVLLGLASFGQEFALGTFPALMAQPMERRQLWRTKVGLMVGAGLLVWVAYVVAVHFRLEANLRDNLDRFTLGRQPWVTGSKSLQEMMRDTRNFYHSQFWHAGVGGGVLWILVGVAGGFWSSLLFRQTGAALWFAILVPGAMLVVSEIVGHFAQIDPDFFLIPGLLVYAVAGIVWARRMFFAAQDAQWLGGVISLNLSSAKTSSERGGARGRRPLTALLRKEFQSHQVSLIIGFGLFVLHIATLVFRKFSLMSLNSEVRFAVEAVPFLWLMLPWVIGSTAVAEERKLGMMESQLCLPVTRRRQFAVKFGVVLFLGIVLGGMMPCVIEFLGTFAQIHSEIISPESTAHSRLITVAGPFFGAIMKVVWTAAGLALISFLASTLTRNTLSALGGAIVIGGIFLAIFSGVMQEVGRYQYSLWRGPLVFLMMIPVWVIVVTGLSFSNYKRLQVGKCVWSRNALVLFVALFGTGLGAAVIYQRPWELAMSLEPRRGAARLSGPVRPVVCTPHERLFVLLPDGRLWAATNFHRRTLNEYRGIWDPLVKSNRLEKITALIPAGGMFVGGSNWVALAGSDYGSDVTALQADGSLWGLIPPNERLDFHSPDVVVEPRRIGTDNDWQSIAAVNGYFGGVKTNGTLWGWGDNEEGRFSFTTQSFVRTPVPMDKATNWAAVFSPRNRMIFVKQNGDVWEWQRVEARNLRLFHTMTWNAADWVSVEGDEREILAVHKDGTLWGAGILPTRLFGVRTPRDFQIWTARNDGNGWTPIGDESDWEQVSGGWTWGPFGLKKDGRLVKSDTELFSATLGRQSSYSDWVAIHAYWNVLVAVSADGTICEWRDENAWNEGWWFLAPTRRPLWSLNIFADTKQ